MFEDVFLKRLRALGQEPLLKGLETLSLEEKQRFFSQIEPFDQNLLSAQRHLLHQALPSAAVFKPLSHCDKSGSQEDLLRGEALIASGKVGCLILGGGQATRLQIDGPKGMVPISPIRAKSLFQLFFERTAAAGKRAQAKLPLAVMTSPLNHRQTETFLRGHQWFGLEEDQVDLFPQKMLPLIDEEGNWLLESPGKVAEGPDGNGGCLQAFFDSGLWQKWKNLGVDYVNVIVVDNALADPFDAEFIGFQARKGAEVALKCVERASADEKMGIVVERGGEICVVEYSELADLEFAEKNRDGSLRYALANTSLFCFRMDWIAQNAQISLPWHLARKKKNGKMICKCETFLFDLMLFAKKVAILLCPRDRCYAPLKNVTGEKSFETVRKTFLAFDREVFREISGIEPPDYPFELDPIFYYPTEELLKRWKGKPLPVYT